MRPPLSQLSMNEKGERYGMPVNKPNKEGVSGGSLTGVNANVDDC